MGLIGLLRADRQSPREFLPADAALNASSVRRDSLSVGRRLEMEPGPAPDLPLAGCPGECASLPPPPTPITVGLDGGYLRDWDHKQAHFVAIVGEIGSSGRPRQAVRLRPEP